MASEHLVDLDELVLRCKDATAKEYIAEAVACYKSGAYRSCIVSTWVAVVYDIIGKLRQLEITDDKNAKSKLAQFEQVRQANDLKRSLEFERNILNLAKDEFELLSPLEYIDLARLQEDRNRCAHPSMNSLDEVYQPPAELARYHLRNAVSHLLQHPPVQGKAALSRLVGEVDSLYFPIDVQGAIRHFSGGPLARPRFSLVRNFMLTLLKGFLLTIEHDEVSERQYAAAINAVRQMHPTHADAMLRADLSRIVREISDDQLWKALKFLHLVADTWQYLEEDVRGRIERYTCSMPDDDIVPLLGYAICIPELKENATIRLQSISADRLAELIALDARADYVDRAVELYKNSINFDMANKYGTHLIIPLAAHFKKRDITRVVRAASENDQIKGSFMFEDVLSSIRAAEVVSPDQFDTLLSHYRLGFSPWAES